MLVDKNEVGKRIYNIRKELGYSMERFGEIIGDAPKGTVNGWEKGKCLPNKKRLETIANIGDTTVNDLLYGSFEDYIAEIAVSKFHIRLAPQMLAFMAQFLAQQGISYEDDFLIINQLRGFLSMTTESPKKVSLLYSPLSSSEKNPLYTAMHDTEEDCKAEYFVYADIKKNSLHILPCFFQKYASDKYSPPPRTTQTGGHSFFSNNFSDIGLSLEGSTLIYYGIDETSYDAQISVFTFNQDKQCYELCSTPNSHKLLDYFERELAKECLYLQTYVQ